MGGDPERALQKVNLRPLRGDPAGWVGEVRLHPEDGSLVPGGAHLSCRRSEV
jgi:hypothetical protein